MTRSREREEAGDEGGMQSSGQEEAGGGDQQGVTLGWAQCPALTVTSCVVSGKPSSLSGWPLPEL